MTHWVGRIAAAVAVFAVLAIAIAWLTRGRGHTAAPANSADAGRPARLRPAGAPADHSEPAKVPANVRPPATDRDAPPPAAPDATDAGAADDSETSQDAIAKAWASVDLEAVRKAMPDNLYFKLAAPTTDEAILAERAAERARWNVEYGKILSGTGSEDDIRNYYDQRARLSSDYIEFTTYLLDHYKDSLPDRDVALLELARRMHATRLQEVPRQVEEAMARKQEQDAARAAWLAGEADFKGDANSPP